MFDGVFGDKVKDKITGFEGIMTGYCTYMTGCAQVLLSGKAGEDGSFKSHWFDIDRLDVIKTQAVKLRSTTPGADTEAPIK